MKNHFFGLFLSLNLLVLSCGVNNPQVSFLRDDQNPTTSAKPMAKDISASAETFLGAHANEVNAQGFVAAVVYNDELVYFQGFGRAKEGEENPPTKDTLFRIGSLSKTFTAMAIIKLRDQGKFLLDDPVEKFIPELSTLKYPTAHSPKITIRHLLTHSSGLVRMPEVSEQAEIGDIIAWTKDSSLLFVPGTKSIYSNLGFGVLGEIVARVSGETCEEFVKRNIFDELSLSKTVYHETEADHDLLGNGFDLDQTGKWVVVQNPDLKGLAPAGNIYSDIKDLTKYMSLQFKLDPTTNNAEILSAESLAEMQRPQYSTDLGQGKAMGFPWFVDFDENSKTKFVNHGGNINGYETAFVFEPVLKVGVIVLANYVSAGGQDLAPKLLSAAIEPLKNWQKSRFKDVAERLLPAINYHDHVHMQSAFSGEVLAGYEGIFSSAFADFVKKNGEIVTIEDILPSSDIKAVILVKTAQGQTFRISITIDNGDPLKIIGILLE